MKRRKKNKIELPSLFWRDVVGFEGHYQVSVDGEARSLDRIDSRGHFWKGKILKPNKSNSGYFTVRLSKNGIWKVFYIHRIVAQAWIPNPDNLPEVNHKDENKLNNHVENLEWCDRKYNANFGTAIQRQKEKQEKHPVVAIDLYAGKIVHEFPSVMSAVKQGFKGVSACCTGVLKASKGLVWRYKDSVPENEELIKIWVEAIQKKSKGYRRPVVAINPQTGEIVHEYSCPQESEIDGYNKSGVATCCKGEALKHKGLIWQYKDELPDVDGRNAEWVASILKRKTKHEPVASIIQRKSKYEPVVAFNPKTGEVVHQFANMYEAKENGFDRSGILKCCCGKLKTHRKLAWRYAGDPYQIPDYKPIVAVDKCGLVIHTFSSVKETGDYGFSPYAVKDCCEGKQKKHHHLFWHYQDDYLKKIC